VTHPTTLAPDVACLTGPAEPKTVRALRGNAAERLESWGLTADAVNTAALVISELLTNALLHGKADTFVLRLALRAGTLRIECDDPNLDQLPQVGAAGRREESGNGMRLVAGLSDAWGYTCVSAAAKTVFAELPARYASAAAA
jgi:anti-sigma regulatory factor (Ser/Thr protein kinase)